MSVCLCLPAQAALEEFSTQTSQGLGASNVSGSVGTQVSAHAVLAIRLAPMPIRAHPWISGQRHDMTRRLHLSCRKTAAQVRAISNLIYCNSASYRDRSPLSL